VSHLKTRAMPLSRILIAVLVAVFIVGETHALAWQQDDAVASDYRTYRLQHRTSAEAEDLLRQRLPVDQFSYRVFTNPQRSNELTVVADKQTFQAVAELLLVFDTASPAANAAEIIVRTYPCRADQLTSISKGMQQTFGGLAGVTVRADIPENRLLVAAPPDIHQQIETWLATAAGGLPRPAPVIDRTNADTGWREMPLDASRGAAVREALLALFDTRLTPERLQDGAMFSMSLPLNQALKFGWTNAADRIYYTGSPEVVDQFAFLLTQLDQYRAGDGAPRIIAYREGNAFPIRNLLRAYGLLPGSLPGNSSSGGGEDGLPVSYGVRQASGELPLFPQDTPAPQTGLQEPVIELPTNQDETLERQNALLRELRDSVQVETLPDLGIIILRGRQKEVDELSRIIQELERLSAEAQPEVRIVELQHTRGEAIQKILQAVTNDLVSSRQGKVTVTPLVKPNALLLVGWGEAIQTMADLIAKLDQPVAADTQFEVFRLSIADATQVQTAITTFFTGRQGLAPQVQLVADKFSNSIIAYASPRDMQEIRRLVENMDVPKYSRKQQAKIVKVHNALAAELATTLTNAIKAAMGTGAQSSAVLELLAIDSQGEQVLRSGVLEEVQVTPNPVNNTLIISGPAESMELMEALVKQLDVTGSTAQIKVFRIDNGDAATLVQMLRSLLPEQTTDRPSMKLSSDAAEESLAPLRFSVDTRTNSIIATGSEGDLRIIEALLVRLDEKEFSQRRNSVYRLKNAPAIEVADAINNFLRSERQAEQVNPATLSPFEQIEREVVVVPERVGNRLILSATPRYFEEVEALIRQLDEPPPQVVIQVLIAEVALDNAEEFGIELGLQDSILFDRSLLGNLLTTTQTTQSSTPAGVVTTTEQIIQAASNEPGFNFNTPQLGNSGSAKSLATAGNVGGQGLSNFAVGRINNELGFGGLVLSASSESVSVLIRALEECRRLEVLSRPMVRTLDNQPAFIQVGQRVPRIIGSTVNQNGQSNAIALENVGLILGVTPRISPDGTVVMEIDAERSGLGPESEGVPVSVAPNGSIIRSPRVDTTTAQATVSAASGETILLGGLITKKSEQLSRGVPWLSDIPLLGNLFRYDSESVKRTELIIVLTPYVISGPADEQLLKQTEFARMNWCYRDVVDIHGDLDAVPDKSTLFLDSPAEETIYPDGTMGEDGGVHELHVPLEPPPPIR
jgi:general secretion pathway protein D